MSGIRNLVLQEHMTEINQKIDTILSSLRELHAKVDAMSGTRPADAAPGVIITPSNKGLTLPELARRAKLANGQQRVAAIVGYFEKIQGKDGVGVTDLQQGWKGGKFPGSYAPVYLSRAIKDGLVRQKEKGLHDLSQTGEDFFAGLFETTN